MEYKHLTDNKVSIQLGLTNGVIGKSRKPGRDLSDRVIELIENYYFDLNAYWLRTGDGEMLKGPVELLADRLSEVINDTGDSLENIDFAFGLQYGELSQFTNNFDFPSTPFDFVKFHNEFPEFNYAWLLTGKGNKFIGDESECLQHIKERIYRKNHPEYFPDDINKEDEPCHIEAHDGNLWNQIYFQNEQLKEKDAQIKQLLDILQKK